MIGYPGIKGIQFKDGLVSIDKTTQQLAEKPADAHLRGILQQQVAKVAVRPISSPQNTSVVAQAQYALGNEEAAKSNLQKALKVNPRAPAALDLQKRIIAVNPLKEQASQVSFADVHSRFMCRLVGYWITAFSAGLFGRAFSRLMV